MQIKLYCKILLDFSPKLFGAESFSQACGTFFVRYYMLAADDDGQRWPLWSDGNNNNHNNNDNPHHRQQQQQHDVHGNSLHHLQSTKSAASTFILY